jgi:hypothetical protein
VYYGWIARPNVALPYPSPKYNRARPAFRRGGGFGVPVISPADSWMADVVHEARDKLACASARRSLLAELPAAAARIAALPDHRAAVERFARAWRQTTMPTNA